MTKKIQFYNNARCWMRNKTIVSVSFGKDSLAMLLKLIETKQHIDEVVFVDTGMEFQAIYEIRDVVVELLNKLKIKYTVCRSGTA